MNTSVMRCHFWVTYEQRKASNAGSRRVTRAVHDLSFCWSASDQWRNWWFKPLWTYV